MNGQSGVSELHNLLDTVFSTTLSPCVIPMGVSEVDLREAEASNLELVGGVTFRKQEVVAVIAPLESFSIVVRTANILHNDVGLAVGKDAELFEFHITHIHRVIALPEPSQQVGSEVVALRRGILTVALFHEWTLATGNTQDSQTDDALGNRQEE